MASNSQIHWLLPVSPIPALHTILFMDPLHTVFLSISSVLVNFPAAAGSAPPPHLLFCPIAIRNGLGSTFWRFQPNMECPTCFVSIWKVPVRHRVSVVAGLTLVYSPAVLRFGSIVRPPALALGPIPSPLSASDKAGHIRAHGTCNGVNCSPLPGRNERKCWPSRAHPGPSDSTGPPSWESHTLRSTTLGSKRLHGLMWAPCLSVRTILPDF